MTQEELMKQSELRRMIENVFEARLDDGQAAPMSWVVKATIDALGTDTHPSGFTRLCWAIAVPDQVREVLRNRKKDEEKPMVQESLLLPGYKRLQRSYTINRKNEQGEEQVLVRLEQMTPEEGKAKATELRSFAAGAMRHADEMDDYFSSRSLAMA
jgi:hypothetical protein